MLSEKMAIYACDVCERPRAAVQEGRFSDAQAMAVGYFFPSGNAGLLLATMTSSGI
jgi:hypothetical protein